MALNKKGVPVRSAVISFEGVKYKNQVYVPLDVIKNSLIGKYLTIQVKGELAEVELKRSLFQRLFRK